MLSTALVQSKHSVHVSHWTCYGPESLVNCRELWGVNKKQHANGFIKRERAERGPQAGFPGLVTEAQDPGPQVHPEDVVSLSTAGAAACGALAEVPRTGFGAKL